VGPERFFFAERFLHLGESVFICASFPTATESLDELDSGLLAGGFGLHVGALFVEVFAIGVDYFEEAHQSGLVAKFDEARGFPGGRSGLGLRCQSTVEVVDARECVFDITEGAENRLTVVFESLPISGMRAVDLIFSPSESERSKGDVRADGPESAFGIEEVGSAQGGESARRGERNVGQAFRNDNAAFFSGDGKTAFRGGDVGPAAEEVGRNTSGNCGRARRGGGGDLECRRIGSGENGEGVFQFGASQLETIEFGAGGFGLAAGAGGIDGCGRSSINADLY